VSRWDTRRLPRHSRRGFPPAARPSVSSRARWSDWSRAARPPVARCR